MRVNLLLFCITALFLVSCTKQNTAEPPVNLIDTCVICNQVWTQKNLSVSQYRNGDPIPYVPDSIAWSNLSTGAWCWYKNDSATYAATYGKLYNWYAVTDPRGLAPAGWHIPSETEWRMLIDSCLGGSFKAGGKMKESGTAHWLTPNTDATDSTGFTALPGGYRALSGEYMFLGYYGYWWTSTERLSISAWVRYLNYFTGRISSPSGSNSNVTFKKAGCSVRCIRD